MSTKGRANHRLLCSFSVHSKIHFTVLMASNNGSVFAWMARSAKIIQLFSPDFHVVEKNIWYVEREDEFDQEISDEDIRADRRRQGTKKVATRA